MSKPAHFPSFTKKKCTVCKCTSCYTGKYLKVPGDVMHQRWVCAVCILKAQNSIVLWNIGEGHLEVAEVARVARGDTCPMACYQNPPQGCLMRQEGPSLLQSLVRGEGVQRETTPLI